VAGTAVHQLITGSRRPGSAVQSAARQVSTEQRRERTCFVRLLRLGNFAIQILDLQNVGLSAGGYSTSGVPEQRGERTCFRPSPPLRDFANGIPHLQNFF
jgi:hypothetical protein